MPYANKTKSAKLDKSYPEIGVIVRGIMKDQRMTQRKLGKMLGWHNTTISLMLKRRIWNVAELLEVGGALKTDLLKYFYPVPPEPMVPLAQLQEAQNRIEALNTELKNNADELLKLRTENSVLREVVLKR